MKGELGILRLGCTRNADPRLGKLRFPTFRNRNETTHRTKPGKLRAGKAQMSALSPLETLEADEAAMIAEMTDILRRKMQRDYAVGATRRDAHPKTVGLLRGTFRIEPGLPAALRVGVFARARSYKCWVRASNASGKIQSDAARDARGFALKLMAPAGKGAAEVSLGQDFVLMNSPVMPLGTIKLFRDAIYYAIESSPLLLGAKLLLTGQAGVLLGLLALRSKPNSPLDIRYWSTTPYRLGPDQAVKYSLLPTSTYHSPQPTTVGDTYLSEAMHTHLAEHEASFDFCVQLRKGQMPIEDAGPRWSERKSPFVKVATLQIPKQDFGSKKRQEVAESLSFSPGHALPAHAPLGGLNRARVAIYTALSAFRHARDGRADLA